MFLGPLVKRFTEPNVFVFLKILKEHSERKPLSITPQLAAGGITFFILNHVTLYNSKRNSSTIRYKIFNLFLSILVSFYDYNRTPN